MLTDSRKQADEFAQLLFEAIEPKLAQLATINRAAFVIAALIENADNKTRNKVCALAVLTHSDLAELLLAHSAWLR